MPIGSVRSGILGSGVAIPDGGIARYEFEQTVEDSWNDNDGTLNGASYVTNSAVGTYALDFDGDDDYVELPAGLGEGLSELTLTAWVEPDALDNNERILANDDNNVFQLRDDQQNSNSIEFSVADGTGSFFTVTGGNANVTTGSYFFIAGVFDGSDLVLYINDTEVARNNIGSITTNAPNDITYIGANNDPAGGATGPFWDGRVDDPRIYSKGLSATEESNLYNTGSIDG